MVSSLKKKQASMVLAHIAKEKTTQKQAHLKGLHSYFFSAVSEDFLQSYYSVVYDLFQGMYGVMQKRRGKKATIQIEPLENQEDGKLRSASVIYISVEDSPFLVDSIRMELVRSGLDLKGMVNLASISVCRSSDGSLKEFSEEDGHKKEACFLFIVPAIVSTEEKNGITDRLLTILQDVNRAVSDWGAMKDVMEESIQSIAALPNSCFSKDEREEACAFLSWLKEYFTFLGCRSYSFKGEGSKARLDLIEGSSLGVLRDVAQARKKRYYSDMALDTRAYAQSKRLLIVAKTNTRSTIHRPPYTDYIIIKKYNDQGEFVGEIRFIGLFTSDAYESDPTRIPFLQRKVNLMVEKAQLVNNGYAHKRLIYLLKTFPRDELFQSTDEQLFKTIMGVLHMQDRAVTKVFFRKDIFHRYISCLVYLPRENFTTELAHRIEDLLKERLHASECIVDPTFSESALARIYFVIRVDSTTISNAVLNEVEEKIHVLSSGWRGQFGQHLRANFSDAETLFKRYAHCFTPGYQEIASPKEAVQDLIELRQLTPEDPLRSRLSYLEGGACHFSFKVYSLGSAIPPAQSLPMLRNMGLMVESEHGAKVLLPDHDQPCWVVEFRGHPISGTCMIDDTLPQRFTDAFLYNWQGRCECDLLSSLVMVAGLSYKEVWILRAYSAYFKQIAFPVGMDMIHHTLQNYPHITAELINYFHKKFQPDQAGDPESLAAKWYNKVCGLFGQIERLDEERVMRQFLETINATVRTNYYQEGVGASKLYLAYKLRSNMIPHMPKPAPMFEIFVFSARFEAVHLRADRIARGGLRWSDRDDFRTEILGLVKAQQVKNALIVPAGAKGGFVLKHTQNSLPDLHAEGLACYSMFISAMLEITDNLHGKRVLKPQNVVCHDDDDPYLVVAADKGTSANSDRANELALTVPPKPFWLGDAFASGGSNGYDHKAMGITAKGAWEAVKWHFKTLGQDIENEPFTVVGIGGMAGDVFGNGMLLSKQIKLIAAFDHNSIFIDPNPDPKVSYKERERLFKMPGSGWPDYNAELISQGGGIYCRSLKSITLSEEACEALGITTDKRTMGPDQLIQTILKAPVDLLWNGGIGTYIKSCSEHHVDVGDPANDALRVDGRQLRCRMVAEGGNLGATQLGRVEYALHAKGCVNTDFIDNSAGVDCSDHEVNIKILLNQLVEKGDLTQHVRDQWLAKMEDEVSVLVLANNVDQNLSLSLEQDALPDYLYLYETFMDRMELDGHLDKALEFLPTHQQLHNRKVHDATLTRPELSVLLAYAKNRLKDDILTFDLRGEPLANHFVYKAFPASLVKKYDGAIGQHRLYDAILATELSNAFIADVGLSFISEMRLALPFKPYDLIKAYLFLYKVYDLAAVKQMLAEATDQLPMPLVIKLYQNLRIILRTSMRWVLCHGKLDYNNEKVTNSYAEKLKALLPKFPGLLQGHCLEKWQHAKDELETQGLPLRIAKKIANMSVYYPCLNVVACSYRLCKPEHEVARFYFTMSNFFSILPIRSHLSYYDYTNRMEVVARFHLKTELDRLLRRMVLGLYNHVDSHRGIAPFLMQDEVLYQSWQDVMARMHGNSKVHFSVLFVIIKLLESWVEKLQEDG